MRLSENIKMDLKKLFPEYVTILGTPWKIIIKNYKDELYFEKRGANGYCSTPEHEICVCNNHTWPGEEEETEQFHEVIMKRTLRHEIVHALLYESGLYDSAYGSGAWAKNEEMVDWIALQGPKLYKIWEEAGCLEVMDSEECMKWKSATATIL